MADYVNNDPYADIGHSQQLAEQSVRGYGQAASPYLRRSIGAALGGLNAMGALRSGGTVQALNDISTDYGNQIGAFADQATLGAMQTGIAANQARLRNQEFQYQQDQIRRQQQGGLLRTIGGVLGAGIGFMTGGARAAVAGAGSLTGAAGPGGGGSGYASGYGPDDPTFYGGY